MRTSPAPSNKNEQHRAILLFAETGQPRAEQCSVRAQPPSTGDQDGPACVSVTRDKNGPIAQWKRSDCLLSTEIVMTDDCGRVTVLDCTTFIDSKGYPNWRTAGGYVGLPLRRRVRQWALQQRLRSCVRISKPCRTVARAGHKST